MVEGTPQTRLYRFDDFVLDIVAYELRRQGRPVKLALEHLLLGTPLLRPFADHSSGDLAGSTNSTVDLNADRQRSESTLER